MALEIRRTMQRRHPCENALARDPVGEYAIPSHRSLATILRPARADEIEAARAVNRAWSEKAPPSRGAHRPQPARRITASAVRALKRRAIA